MAAPRGGTLVAWRALLSRELAGYFLSPMSYLVWAVVMVAAGYLFATGLKDGGTAEMSGIFRHLAFLMVFAAPLLTMRLVAEEHRQGTLEVLMTDPVGEGTVITAKFTAAVLFLLAMLAPTLAYPAILAWLGSPDPGPVLAGYLGLVLLGSFFLAVGLATSTATMNPVAAATLSFTLLFLLWLLDRAAGGLAPGVAQDALHHMSAFSRFRSFQAGIVDTRSVIYGLGFTAFALFLATRLLGIRRLK